MDKLIIGVGHKKRRGKDTVANRLVKKHGFIKISFADSLKEACRDIFGFTEEQLYGSQKEEVDPYWGLSPREVFQQIGTDVMRNHFDDQIWIKSAWLKAERHLEEENVKGVVIPDVRFPNEANFLKGKGAILWRIDREIEDDANSSHPSEIALDDYKEWSLLISNCGTLDYLNYKVDLAIEASKETSLKRKSK